MFFQLKKQGNKSYLMFLKPVLLMLIIALAFYLSPVKAADSASQGSLERLEKVGEQISSEDQPSLAKTTGLIIKAILSVLGIVFMIYLIYAGWLWLTAAGNEEKISKAKVIIRGSIIGLIIVLAAYLITATVIDRLIEATGYQST